MSIYHVYMHMEHKLTKNSQTSFCYMNIYNKTTASIEKLWQNKQV